MNAMASESNDKMETTSEGTPSTVSADKDDMTTTPSSPISFDRSNFEQHSPNENQTGTLSFPERRNVDEHGQVAATESLKSIKNRFSYRHYKAAPWYSVNINLILDIAEAKLSSMLSLIMREPVVLPPSFPLLKTSFHQNVEGEYEEIWFRSPGVRCCERTLVLMVPGNPGIVKVYLDFMSMICDKHDFDGYVAGHLGHCPFSTKMYGMKDQIAHHRRMIKKHSEPYQRILILAHSIGAHMTLQITDTLVELGDRLIGVGLLAPALTRFPAFPYWTLRFMLKESILVSLLRECSIRMNAPADIKDGIRSGKFVPNIASLVRDALDVLPDEPPSEPLTYWGFEKRKIFIINSSRDPYMSLDVQHSVRCCTESLYTSEPSVLILSCIHHCFVLCVKECAFVASLLEQWIANKRFDCSMYDGFTPDCSTSNRDCVNYFGPTFWGFLSVLALSISFLILHPVFRG